MARHAEDDVSQSEPLTIELRVEPVCLRTGKAAEAVDPDRRVDDDHGLLRPATEA
jgi:hypothetical protein